MSLDPGGLGRDPVEPRGVRRLRYELLQGRHSATSTPVPSTSWAITNTSRQRLGEVYNPGHGRRVQIRDTSRRIIGYIERDGTATNTSRQPVGPIDLD